MIFFNHALKLRCSLVERCCRCHRVVRLTVQPAEVQVLPAAYVALIDLLRNKNEISGSSTACHCPQIPSD